MENDLIHSYSVSIADTLNRYVNKEGLEYKKMVLGAEILLINVTKLLAVYALSCFLGLIPLTVSAMLGYGLIRRFAFGLHAKSSNLCTLASILMFVAAPYFLKGLVLSNGVVLCLFTLVLTALYLYAPADTESRPIIGVKRRARLRKSALLSGGAVMLAALLIPISAIKIMVTLGAVYEAIFILPLTYKILKRSWKNYEKYQ